MEQIPDFWRTEVFHPLSVHFPVALLTVAFLFKVIGLKWNTEVWTKGGSVLLGMGVIGLWIAVYTGNLADGIVSRKICDPTILKTHQNYAWATGWIFSGACLLDLAQYFRVSFLKNTKISALNTCILAIGTAGLIYVGHLGATLVYQQAAGVYVPSDNCAEYE